MSEPDGNAGVRPKQKSSDSTRPPRKFSQTLRGDDRRIESGLPSCDGRRVPQGTPGEQPGVSAFDGRPARPCHASQANPLDRRRRPVGRPRSRRSRPKPDGLPARGMRPMPPAGRLDAPGKPWRRSPGPLSLLWGNFQPSRNPADSGQANAVGRPVPRVCRPDRRRAGSRWPAIFRPASRLILCEST